MGSQINAQKWRAARQAFLSRLWRLITAQNHTKLYVVRAPASTIPAMFHLHSRPHLPKCRPDNEDNGLDNASCPHSLSVGVNGDTCALWNTLSLCSSMRNTTCTWPSQLRVSTFNSLLLSESIVRLSIYCPTKFARPSTPWRSSSGYQTVSGPMSHPPRQRPRRPRQHLRRSQKPRVVAGLQPRARRWMTL